MVADIFSIVPMTEMTELSKNALNASKKVDGFLKDSEAIFLYKSAYSQQENATIVEIGSYMGKSTILMAMGLRDSGNTGAKVYAVDHFVGSSEHENISTFESFRRYVSEFGVEDYIQVIKTESQLAAEEWDIGDRIDFLWIDGGHEYEYVSMDLLLWYRHVRLGGVIAVHDAGGFKNTGQFMGVRKAVRDHMFGQLVLRDYHMVDSILAARKTHNITNDDRLNTWKARIMWEHDVDSLSLRNLLRVIGKYYRYIPRRIRNPAYWFKG